MKATAVAKADRKAAAVAQKAAADAQKAQDKADRKAAAVVQARTQLGVEGFPLWRQQEVLQPTC
jgi:hypothetical protein